RPGAGHHVDRPKITQRRHPLVATLLWQSNHQIEIGGLIQLLIQESLYCVATAFSQYVSQRCQRNPSPLTCGKHLTDDADKSVVPQPLIDQSPDHRPLVWHRTEISRIKCSHA